VAVNQTPAPPSQPDPPDQTNAVSAPKTAEPECFSEDLKLGQLLWPEPWASQAAAQADNIGRVARLAFGDAEPTQYQKSVIDAIDHLLRHVRESCARRSWWQRPLDRWRGTSIERAYSNLHAAKVLLVELLPTLDIDALIPSAVAIVSDSLRRRDIRRIDTEALLTEQDTLPPEEKRARVKRALQIGYDALDQQHTRIRGFRNLLIIVSAVIAAFMVILVALVWRTPQSMPLCFEPSITSAQPPGQGSPSATGTPTPVPSAAPTPSASKAPTTPAPTAAPTAAATQQPILSRRVCPSGQDPSTGVSTPREPTSKDVAIVAGLGLLGGAVAAAFAIRKVRGTSTPYDVPLALAILKVPTGALTAVVGIVLLGGGFVPGFSELDSQRQILAYALIFGYAQQLATRLIDNHAQNILGAVHSKDSKSKPARPAPAPAQRPMTPSVNSEPAPQTTRQPTEPAPTPSAQAHPPAQNP
jgi:hypothetical protein